MRLEKYTQWVHNRDMQMLRTHLARARAWIAGRLAGRDPKQLALEWSGCILGLGGAAVLATNTSASRYGWIAFLMANFAVIGFARMIRAHGLLVQQCGFMLTSLLGIYRAFFPHF